MAGSLERKRSKTKMPGGGSSYGCIGGLFHFLDVNQRLHAGKMVTYNKKGVEEKPAERTKSPKVQQDASASGRHLSMDKDENIPEDAVDDKGGISRNSSGKVLMRSVNSRRRPRDPQLLRTISIHYLESDDYVDDVDHNSENPTVVHNSHESGSSINREHISLLPKVSDAHAFQEPSELHGILKTSDCASQTKPNKLPDHLIEKHSLLREKLNYTKEALSRKKSTDSGELEQDAAFDQSKEFLEVMVLLNNNRDLLLKILKNPSAFANFLESQQSSSLERVFDRSGSFPVSGLSCEQNDEVSRHKHWPQKCLIYERGKFQAGRTSSRKPRIDADSAGAMESIADGNISTPKSESGSIRGARIGSGHGSSDMIPSSSEPKDQKGKQWGNRTASARFKIIKKRIKDVVKDNKMESLRISMDGVLDKIPYGSKLTKGGKRKKQDLLGRPATTRYDREASTSKSMKRSHSLHESLEKYSRLLDTTSGRKFFRAPVKSKTKKEVSLDSKTAYPQRSLGRIFSLEFDSNSLRKAPQYEVLGAVQSLKLPMVVDIHDVGEPRIVEDTFVHAEESQGANNGLRAQDYIDSPFHGNGIDPNDWLTKTSAVCYLDLHFPENSPQKKFFAENIIPPQLSASEDSELKPSQKIHLEELDTLSYQQSQSDTDFSDQLEGITAESQNLQVHTELDDYYSFFGVPVDLQHEARFTYVRDILWKSGFGSNEFLRAWYSPNQPIDPLLLEETECSISAAETARNGPEMFLKNQLLFDLINEVLLEIYDTSSSSYPWLSRFDTNARPMPSGYHVLEELWAKISWYLSSQPQLDATLDRAVARDLAKDYGWMDIQYDCEDVALELEDLILEDLLDDVVVELGKFSGFDFALF